MGARGIFHPEERVELIDGVIYEMFPINPPHAYSVLAGESVLAIAFGPGYHVRTQQPLHLGPRSEPIPDIAVVQGARDDYSQQHPTTALLLVEVSDSTLWSDRRRKGGLYARAGIADYWIVNLKKRQLEVYRTPIADAAHHYGHRYANVTVLTPADAVLPLAAAASRICVGDLLP